MTNADKIRAMTDEELSFQLAMPTVISAPWCSIHTVCPHLDKDPAPCDKCALEWLKKEYKP